MLMILIAAIKMEVTFVALPVILSSPWPYEGATVPPVLGEDAEAERGRIRHTVTLLERWQSRVNSAGFL